MLEAIRHFSLRARIVAVLFTLFALVAALLMTALPSYLDAQLRREVESRAVGIAAILAAGLGAPLDFDDAPQASAQLHSLRAAPEVVYAEVLRSDGSRLAPQQGSAMPPSLEPSAEPVVMHTAGMLHLRVPIATRGAGTGALLLGFSLHGIEAEKAAAFRKVAYVSLAILVLGIAAALGISTVLVRPIRRVTQVAQAIARGEHGASARLELGRTDEVGQMSLALNRMLRRLYDQQALLEAHEASLRSLNGELESRVADRTQALERANGQLEERLIELRTTQEQLIVADRRVSIARLAAGVAHEINNPLAYVIGNLRFISEELDVVDGARRDCTASKAKGCSEQLQELQVALAETRQGADRVKHIVQSLKTLSRGDEDKREPVDVHRCLDSAVSMAANEIRHRARLTLDYQPIPAVEANEVRLGQVFLNLLMNAAQSINEGNVEANEIRVGARTDDEGRVVIEIADTGSGMAPEVQARLFDPFFTTKPVGEGTGLGLSISRGIVTAIGGTISVESELERGSVFRVVLPPAQTAAVTAGAATRAPASPARARVLVIDDEPLVGASVRRNLAREHDVVLATSGSQGLAHLSAGQPFDLILCDLMMPEMTGMDFFAAIEQSQPDAAEAVLFMTGGAFTAAAKEFLERHADRRLDKPLDFDELRQLLRARAASREKHAPTPVLH